MMNVDIIAIPRKLTILFSSSSLIYQLKGSIQKILTKFYFCGIQAFVSKQFLDVFGFVLSCSSIIHFENLCTFIMCSVISSQSVLQLLHMYLTIFFSIIASIETDLLMKSDFMYKIPDLRTKLGIITINRQQAIHELRHAWSYSQRQSSFIIEFDCFINSY